MEAQHEPRLGFAGFGGDPVRPLERPQHDPPCFDDEATCRQRVEREEFEWRLQEAESAFLARHGHRPPTGWAERHRARFRAWQAAKTARPGLRFADWLREHRATVQRDAAGRSEELPPLEAMP